MFFIGFGLWFVIELARENERFELESKLLSFSFQVSPLLLYLFGYDTSELTFVVYSLYDRRADNEQRHLQWQLVQLPYSYELSDAIRFPVIIQIPVHDEEYVAFQTCLVCEKGFIGKELHSMACVVRRWKVE